VSAPRTDEDRQAQGPDGFVFPSSPADSLPADSLPADSLPADSLPADGAGGPGRATGDGPAAPARAA